MAVAEFAVLCLRRTGRVKFNNQASEEGAGNGDHSSKVKQWAMKSRTGIKWRLSGTPICERISDVDGAPSRGSAVGRCARQVVGETAVAHARQTSGPAPTLPVHSLVRPRASAAATHATQSKDRGGKREAADQRAGLTARWNTPVREKRGERRAHCGGREGGSGTHTHTHWQAGRREEHTTTTKDTGVRGAAAQVAASPAAEAEGAASGAPPLPSVAGEEGLGLEGRERRRASFASMALQCSTSR